jgi:putative phosphoribosyl transferase
VLAVPVGAPETLRELDRLADDVIAVEAPDFLMAVGASYADFRQTTDAEVEEVMDEFLPTAELEVEIELEDVRLPGELVLPQAPVGVVLFAHGSGSSRHSPRNQAVAARLRQDGIGTLLFDLLTPAEAADRSLVFDVEMLAGRLAAASGWLNRHGHADGLPLGYFGASTGAAAALMAAAALGDRVAAVVSRGGRPDLAGPLLPEVTTPTLLIVGSQDRTVLELNIEARARMRCVTALEVVPGAGHLFEEPGTLDRVADLAAAWFAEKLGAQAGSAGDPGGELQ